MDTAAQSAATRTVTLCGQIVGLAAVQACKDLEELKDTECSRVVVDLRQVTYMDSCGLGGLMYIKHVLEKQGKKLVLKAPGAKVKELFRDCSIEGAWEIVEA
jgi:anti-anti-sigma factor